VEHWQPDFIAELHLFPTEVSGRKNPIINGYRPSFDMGVPGMWNDALMEMVGMDRIDPGGSATVRVAMVFPDFQVGRLHPGFTFDLHDVNKHIGRGEILEVLNPMMCCQPR